MKRLLLIGMSLFLNTLLSNGQEPTLRNDRVGRIVSQISPANLRSTVDKLVSSGTRHTLSDTVSQNRGIGASRRWIKSEFERIAGQSSGRMSVEFFETVVPPSNRVSTPTKVVDVVATLKGRNPERLFVVGGHYDSRATDVLDAASNAPGANDDGSGTALVLECAQVLSNYEFNASIVFIAFAGEEQGLLGATAWAEMAKQKGFHIEGMLNNDIIGSVAGGDGTVESTYVRVFSEAYSPADTGTVFRMRNTLGLENDGGGRSLARYIEEIASEYVPGFGARMIYRRDRFLRGGDHSPFHERGYSAVRFSVVKENYDWQHQNVRTENGKHYGDLPEFMNFDYCANVVRVNAATLANLAFAPPAPANVRVVTTGLGYETTLRWNANKGADVVGYLVRYRETRSPQWQGRVFTADTTLTLKVSKDDYIFGVQTLGKEGSTSLPVIPVPVR